MTQRHWDGRCYCGAVRYRVTAPAKFVAHDHCSICRRIAGAAFVTWGGVLRPQFELVSGEDALTTFASSPEATRQFCRHCGSHLFFRSSQWPEEHHFTLSTITAPEGLVPAAHVYYSDRAAWLDGSESLPRRGGATGLEPL